MTLIQTYIAVSKFSYIIIKCGRPTYRELVRSESIGAVSTDELLEGDDGGDDQGELSDDESLGSDQTDDSQDDRDDGEQLETDQHQDGEDLLFQLGTT